MLQLSMGVTSSPLGSATALNAMMNRVAGRLTILTPSLTAVLTPTQTFFPSSHFDTADENLYDSSSPVTTSQLAPDV